MLFRRTLSLLALTSSLVAALACRPRAHTVTPNAEAAADASEASDAAAASDSGSAAAPWWGTPYPEPFDTARLSKQLPAVRVKGNRFVDAAGATIVFQGVSIADPDKLAREGQWKRELFEAIQSWGANVVRIPIHPAAYRGIGRDAYFELLDQAAVWATELDLYVIVDWHSIGNLATGLFQHPMYDTTRRETYEFWRSVAFRYREVPAFALYELFNEPTEYNGTLGKASWKEWKAINEELIDIIRAHENDAVPLVAGFNWAYDLTPVAQAPIARPGVAYVSHPYPQKTTAPFAKKWDKAFGFVAAKYPLITTEIGYMPPDAPGAHEPVKDDGSYGPLITDYLSKKGASWVAWCFHTDWAPMLIADWSYTPTASGAHFRQVMQARAGQAKPAPPAPPAAAAAAPSAAAPALAK